MRARGAGCLGCTLKSAERSWSRLKLPSSLTKQTILPSRICSMVDSFRFCFMILLLSKYVTGHAGLVLQLGHELALEPIDLAAAHTLLFTHPAEAHLPVE